MLATGIVALFMLSMAAANTGDAKRSCTHGLSSIGPVYLRDGRVVGDTTPHTEACLP